MRKSQLKPSISLKEKFQSIIQILADIRIELIFQRMVFRLAFIFLKPFKRLFGWFINLQTSFQMFYEENPCYMFGCHGIEVVFKPDTGTEE
jgi:hypothetical protein